VISGRKHVRLAVAGLGAAACSLGIWGGVAHAVSGGGYNPDQQDCSWTAENSSASTTDPAATQPGCHNLVVNVESGGMTNGDANSNNTRYVEFGNNQSSQDAGPGFGGLYTAGDPGTYGSPHSGCVAANTDGTNGGTGTGCGDNSNGAGLNATYDYYSVYCPATSLIPFPANPVPGPTPWAYNCASNQPIGTTNVNPDTGPNNALGTIVTQGLIAYFGMDDNTDNGEHDGLSGVPAGCPANAAAGTYSDANPAPCTDGALNGPSDGGAMTLSVTPLNATNTPTASHPEGAANYSMGFCADGICGAFSTQQQSVYQGCGSTNGSNHAACSGTQNNKCDGNVYENCAPASTQETAACSSGGHDNGGNACFTNSDGSSNPNGDNGYVSNTPQNMNVEPGIQTYQDPDPQRSPAAPFGTPGLYVGTCGVYANDGGGSVGPGISGTLTGGAVNANPGYVVKNPVQPC